jgi:hypothetical protein
LRNRIRIAGATLAMQHMQRITSAWHTMEVEEIGRRPLTGMSPPGRFRKKKTKSAVKSVCKSVIFLHLMIGI